MMNMKYRMKPEKGNRLDGNLKTYKTKLGWKPAKKLKDYLINESK